MELQVFNSTEFGSVRTATVNGEAMFVAKDIATILGYSNPRDAINKHVDDEDKGVAKCDTPGGTQNLVIINESGLYSLILSSKMPNAKKFKRWVTAEVLPAIRKQGKIWLLYQKYSEQGLTSTKTSVYNGSDGLSHSSIHTYWTQKGRLFIYALLKKDGILPIMERR